MRRGLLLALLGLAGCPDPATSLQPRADAAVEVIDAGPLDRGAVDQAILDMQAVDQALLDAEVSDAGQPDAAPPPDPCADVPELSAHATPRGEGFVLDDITRDDDGGHGSCGGWGADRIVHFTAPRAGVWRAHVEATIEGYEPVIHARAACADPASELACRDDLPGVGGAAIQLRLAAGEGAFLFIDADNTRGGFFRLAVDPIPEVAEACDPAGLADACPADAECRAGVCAPRSVPILDAVSVWRQPSGRYGMVFTGRDAGADAVAFLLDPVGRAVPTGAPSRLNIRDLPGRERWSLGFQVNTPGHFALAHRMRVAVIDALDHRSGWLEVPINPSATAAIGEKCDSVRRPCAGRGLCQQGACVAPDRPTILSARGVFNPDDPAIALEARVNPAAQVRRLEVELLDGDGRRIERLTADVTAGLQGPSDVPIRVERRLGLEPPVEAVAARLTALGAAGWESSPVEIELARAEPRAEGEACDPGRARSHCAPDTTCLDGLCTAITAECPADWAALPVEGEGPWRVIGSLGGEVQATRPSCGGGAHAVVHVFEAPEDGEYLITAYSGELRGDPVLAIRSHCGYDGRTHPEFELACNDDALRLNARLVVSLTAGQRIFPVVDGHADWRGGYVLLIDRR